MRVDSPTSSSVCTIRLMMIKLSQTNPDVNPNITRTRLLCASMSSETHGGHLHTRSVALYKIVKSTSVNTKHRAVTQNTHSIELAKSALLYTIAPLHHTEHHNKDTPPIEKKTMDKCMREDVECQKPGKGYVE